MSGVENHPAAPTPGDAPGTILIEHWFEGLRRISLYYRLPLSPQSVRQELNAAGSASEDEKVHVIARQLGVVLRPVVMTANDAASHLPFIVRTVDGEVAVVHTLSADGRAGLWMSGEDGLESQVPFEELLSRAQTLFLARPARSVPDARVDAYIKPFEEGWLRRIVMRDVGSYGYVFIASFIANTLGLAGIVFSMQVYDRVVPAQSFNTLYVLFSGVVLAIGFDFMMRRARMSIIDLLGRKSDLQISDVVFGRALRVRNRARPTSTGAFIAQLRDIDQVREMLTSTTIAALADLPFFFLFAFVYWWLVGNLVLIPLAALALLVLPGLLLQGRLRAHANESMREASLRNAMLVETVQGIEDIKSLQAEARFQRQWNHLNTVTGEAQIKLRGITNGLNVWTQNVQTGVYAATVFIGAPLVIEGDLTTGALVGASILGSRMLAPMGQFSQLAGRWQQARVAKGGLDQVMQMPVDHPESESRIHRPRIEGRYRLRKASFRYGDDASPPALTVQDLTIDKGERIAVLGRNGSGKSTLLLGLSGILDPSEGEILLDDLALGQIDPADVRRDVALVTQNSRLFFGTLRDNITMGAASASDAQIQNALAMVGAQNLVRSQPRGLEHVVQEGGHGLSGGQKQSILLARQLIRDASVILLDEPTAAMDEATERHFIAEFAKWSAGRTVLIATHRTRVLELADRILVVENGRIALDDIKKSGLRKLVGVNKVTTSPARHNGRG